MVKNTLLSLPNRIMITQIVILTLLSLIIANIDHCSVTKPSDTIGLMNTESLSITLGDYIRGYNLAYTTSKPLTARPSNPMNSIASVEFNFQQGYKIINADVNKCNCGRWFQEGLVFAQKDSTSVGLVVTKLTGTRSIANTLEHQYYTLDTPATCFSANVIDSDYNIVLDCQTTSDPDNQQDMICFISTKQKKLKSCLKIDSLNIVNDNNRKSQIIDVNGQIFLISGTHSRQNNVNEISYLTIYHIDTINGAVEFVNIIDGYQLGLDYELVISDFDVTPGGRIYIHDLVKSQILFVKYTEANDIVLLDKWVYGSKGITIKITSVNSILIATTSYIEQYDLTYRYKIFRYQLPKIDNDVTRIAVSTYAVTVTTMKNNLYVYQRIMSPANYILGAMKMNTKNFLLSPYANVLYTFTEKNYNIYEMTSGTLSLTGITESQNITITATSSTSQCSFTLQIISIDSASKILTKQNINQKQFITQDGHTVDFNLEDIFSGQNLRYSVPQSTKDVNYTLEQLNQYDIESGLTGAVLKQVVSLNKTTFLQLGLWSTQAYLQLCSSNDITMKITCKTIYTSRILAQNPIILSGKQRKSGQVVFVWTAQGTQHEILTFNNGKVTGISYLKDGSNYEYSSIVIAEDKIYFVLKQYGMIAIRNDGGNSNTYVVLDAKSFEVMNKQLVGFYPRQLYLHPRDNLLFYVKFPRHVCLMTVFETIPKAIDCKQVLERIIPQQQWSVIVGMQTFVVITPNTIAQYSILGNNATILHTLTIPSTVTFPIFYNQFLNTAIMRTSTNQLMYYKLNKPIIDCIYFQSQLKSQKQLQAIGQMISSQGYWSVNGLATKAYRQSYNTKLSIEFTGDNNSFSENLNISISVKGRSEEIHIDDNVTVFKYKTQIDVKSSENNVINLPASANEEVRIPISMGDYFDGPRAENHIVCDYCGDSIKLETFFQNRSVNGGINGNARSIVEVFGNYAVVLTTSNMLYLIAKDQSLTTKASTTIHITSGQCLQLSYNPNFGLLVYCSDPTTQQLIHFTLTESSITQSPSSFPLQQQSMLNYSPSQIIISSINNTQSYWLLIHDDDESLNTLSKSSNIKVFLLSNNGDGGQVIQFKGVMNSATFGVNVNQPINDIEVEDNMIMVTIGNYGIGYAWLGDKPGDIVLQNIASIELRKIDQIKSNLLDNSIFQQVDILPAFNPSIKVLLTSTTSIPMVINFVNKNNILIYSSISEKYGRYGSLETVNWHAINQHILLLKYYNTDTFEEYIVGYNRTEEQRVDFIDSLTRKITPQKAIQHTVLLTKQGWLAISEPKTNNSGSQLVRYDLTVNYSLLLTYSQAGDFSTIVITSSNVFSSQNVNIVVEFDHNSNDSGVQWYTIVIIILIVVIVCGTAYGMYLKMIKNRKDKKVSLLTEGEEVDQEI